MIKGVCGSASPLRCVAGNEEKRRTEGKPGGRQSVRDSIFGEDADGYKPSGEEVEYQRHASVKLTSFLDQLIVVVEGYAAP